MKPALHQQSPLNPEGRDEKVKADRTKTIALQKSHEKSKTDKDHYMHILKAWCNTTKTEVFERQYYKNIKRKDMKCTIHTEKNSDDTYLGIYSKSHSLYDWKCFPFLYVQSNGNPTPHYNGWTRQTRWSSQSARQSKLLEDWFVYWCFCSFSETIVKRLL